MQMNGENTDFKRGAVDLLAVVGSGNNSFAMVCNRSRADIE